MPSEELYYLGVKALILNKQGQVLLLEIAKNDRVYIDLPGGRINKGESIDEALARELREETGIFEVVSSKLLGMAPTIIRIPINTDVDGGLIFALYACEVAVPDAFQPEANMKIVWCDKQNVSEALTNFPPELRRTIEQYLAR